MPEPNEFDIILRRRNFFGRLLRAPRLFLRFYRIGRNAGGSVIYGLRVGWSMTQIMLKSYKE